MQRISVKKDLFTIMGEENLLEFEKCLIIKNDIF